jgi:hypothetical protein
MVRIAGLEFVGQCIDVFTGAPIEGLDVQVSAGPAVFLVTDSEGRFSVDDVRPGATSVEITTGSTTAVYPYHRLNQVFIVERDSTHTFGMVQARPTTAPELGGISLLEFFKELTETVDSPTLLAKWHSYPVPCYIPPFINTKGVDYGTITQTAAQRWMDVTGIQLFTFVSSRPDTGVAIVYKPWAEISPLSAFTKHNVGADSHPILDEIAVRDDIPPASESFLYRVMLHELGHTIRFGHLNLNNFIMYAGQPLPPDIHEDERAAAVLHQALPTRVDMAIYDSSFP